MYNSPIKNQRVFEADYPHGAQADETGKLLKTIDGDDITARLVVGRKVAGGADEAITPAAFDAIAEAIAGRATAILPQSLLGRDVGRVRVNKASKRPLDVALSSNLTTEKLPAV